MKPFNELSPRQKIRRCQKCSHCYRGKRKVTIFQTDAWLCRLTKSGADECKWVKNCGKEQQPVNG